MDFIIKKKRIPPKNVPKIVLVSSDIHGGILSRSLSGIYT